MPTARTFQLDIDTKRYLARVNVSRKLNGLGNLLPPDVADIDNFVVGLKDLGVWTNTVCWLMGSKYNVGAGTTALCMNNFYDATLVSSPTWNPNWIDTSPTGAYMTGPYVFANTTLSTGSIISCFSNFASNYGLAYVVRSTIGNITGFGTRNSTTQIYTTRFGNNSIVTKAALNTNNMQFASCRFSPTPTNVTTRWNGTNTSLGGIGYYIPSNATVFQIGRELTTQYAVRCSLLLLLKDVVITDAQHDSIESLVKTSIGKTLSLP